MKEGNQINIVIKGAKENNLKNVSLSIPHNKFIVVTGISGSGKSSLIFDVIAREGQRRYFETLPSFVRQFTGKLNKPNVDSIEGLSPVISIGQQTNGANARSTVGTISDIYDLLRLLFARVGKTDRNIELSRSLFSFNSDHGKCKRCAGVGKEEEIDLNKLIVHPEKTIREGALAPTLPTGYIMYSQVTINVLNQVCEAEGFNVDIPWRDLTEDQKKVVLYGSEKIKVPFGKHSIESRLKWTGIKAKPREDGYFKGMIPIMSDILKRDRNANILKYVKAVVCPVCNGSRLNEDALSVRVNGQRIIDLCSIELNELLHWFQDNFWCEIGSPITEEIKTKLELLEDLGLGHLTLNRPAASLASSELQRIRIGNQILVPLSNVLYVFDEPSIGLHPSENIKMIHHFKKLVSRGNTVLVVEHDITTIKNADHIIDIGPLAGAHGGEVLFNGSLDDFVNSKERIVLSRTQQVLLNTDIQTPMHFYADKGSLKLEGCSENNLKSIDVEFKLGGLNVVSGKSGSGKSSLIKSTLLRVIENHLSSENRITKNLQRVKNIKSIDKLVFIDHSPIGRTPRSNPATYLGISDYIRDLYSKLPDAKEMGITKSMFSFNNKGGRCETCQGAGKIQVGMHFLGNVDLTCPSCGGKRFTDKVLRIKYSDKSISDVYNLTVSEALTFFKGIKRIESGLNILDEIGLGYIRLGQSSTTLSGGEAQRIKIANQLQKRDTGNTIYIIIEPTIGLHAANTKSLLSMLYKIKEHGNTIVCVEQNQSVIDSCDWHIELGPHSGANGGEIVHQGKPEHRSDENEFIDSFSKEDNLSWIQLNGVKTNGLKNIDVKFPKNKLSVVTGVSGSGKSSLVYDTLFAESHTRFTESLSTYGRSFIKQSNNAKIESSFGLGPAIGLNRRSVNKSSRSTVATITGIYDALRLLYSRISQYEGKELTAQDFSFNHHLGACEICKGDGFLLECNPDQIIIDKTKSIFKGALAVSKAVKYFTNPDGQFMAILKKIASVKEWNLNIAWEELPEEVKDIILFGIEDVEWEVEWEFKTKTRSGVQRINEKWLGFCRYINEEFERKKFNKGISELKSLLHEVECKTCNGSRLKSPLLDTKFTGLNIHEFTKNSLIEIVDLLKDIKSIENDAIKAIAQHILPSIESILNTLIALGLGHLNLDRPVKSLSGGEQQRVSIASQLSNHLFGVTYVLDEPTIGLDQKQINTIIALLKELNSKGNTVVVVEHDKSFIEQADYLVEMGPSSGRNGGDVIYQGFIDELHKSKTSSTYALIHSDIKPAEKFKGIQGKPFGVNGAVANNLKEINVEFAYNSITAVTGVSGSGKTSLIRDAFFGSWNLNRPYLCDSLFGMDQFDEVIYIDQATLVTNQLSTPATYLNIIDHLKIIYVSTEKAKSKGLIKSDFSYLSKKGKCPVCGGNGKIKTAMDFMSDVWLECYSCKGKRYSNALDEVRINNRSIGELMQLTLDELLSLDLSQKLNLELEALLRIGIGHLVLGQSTNSLSGGEIQRLKLGKEISKKREGNLLYILDEPSTGLHLLDIQKLISAFNLLKLEGHSIIFIEHNEILINAADDVIRLGPGSGIEGGRLL